MTECVRNCEKSTEHTTHHGKEIIKEEPKPDQFQLRESPFTILFEKSDHIRSIYYLFIVCFILQLLGTAAFDLVEYGQLNLGFHRSWSLFTHGSRDLKLWLYELLVAASLHPLLLIYTAVGKKFVINSERRRIWTLVGVFGLAGVQVALMSVPLWVLGKNSLKGGTGAIAATEMCRFAMKIHAIAMACGMRYLTGSPLPSFRHYLYFLFAPTLLYKDQYPRTKKIRWKFVVFHFTAAAASLVYIGMIIKRYCYSYWSEFGMNSTVKAGTVVRGFFFTAFFGILTQLVGCYGFLHSWLNGFAELMKFGDRLFYGEWWTTSCYVRYYRQWNRVVYSWLRLHIHQPLIPRCGRTWATFIVFFVSGVMHEVCISIALGFCYPILFVVFVGTSQLLMKYTSEAARKHPRTMNFLIWLSICNGYGVIWSQYAMEYFARKNCPPSETDSFFVPKFWSCPIIIWN